MVQFRNQEKEIIFKIVYYGPALGGKTTNLETLHKITDPEGKSKLTSLKTSEDRTLFFDLLPFDLGEIQGYHIRVQIYTVPGQVHYNTTRRIVLSGADAVVFVADSQIEKLDENRVSFENMKANLLANKMDLGAIPLIIQCNKIDLQNIASKEEILRKIGYSSEKVEVVSSSAIRGDGVVETFRKAVARSIIDFANRFKLYQKGVTEQKLEESVKKFFEPFEEVRLKPSTEEKKKIEAKVPLRGLSEEEQLEAALKSTTEIAEQFNEVERLNNLYKEKIKEVTFLSDLAKGLDNFTNIDNLVIWAFDRIAEFKPDFYYTLFKYEKGKVKVVKMAYLEKDPLLIEGNAPSGNFVPGIVNKKKSLRLDNLPARIEELTGKYVNIPETVYSLFLENFADSYYSLFIYCQKAGNFTTETERYFNLFAEVVNSKSKVLKLLYELEQLNSQLEKKVVERTAALSKALEDLKEVDKVKRAFLNSASHEIKTPLSNIKAHCDFLIRHPEMWLEKGKGYLSQIKSNSERLEELVTTLLSFSFVKEPFRGENSNLVEILNSVVASLSSKIKSKEIETVVECDKKDIVFPINKEDASLLMKQIIDNGVKFSPLKGKLKIFLIEDGKRVIFSVRDYGQGFSKESRALLFEPVVQGFPEAPSFKEEGLGMGLFLVREVLRKYGGTLHIEEMEPGANVLVEFTKN
jgi:signal transduction histidine kinase/signal recognition particle receptor subunit beta